MRIAIIEQGHREYLLDIFAWHSDFAVEIVCFAEWKPMAQWHQEIPIISLSELKEQEYDIVLIAVSHNHRLSRLLTYLHDRGVENLYAVRLFVLDTHADFIANGVLDLSCVDRLPKEPEKPYLVHLETHVCDQCNLNCKACNNFSPFVNERSVADIVQFHEDLQKLAGLFSNIGRFFLLGGEPLLEPELCCEMLGIARRCFPSAELRVLTNALLIHQMSSEFWDCLRENDVIVHISVYPPVLGQLEEIETILRTYGVKYLLARKVEKFAKRLTLYPFEDAKHNNNVCGSAGCHYLRNGRVAKCPDGILVGNMAPGLGCEPKALQDSKVINITGENDGWEVIRKLNAPCDLCKRCTHRRLEAITWEAVKNVPDPADWLIENRLEYENGKLSEQLQNMIQKKERAEAELGDVKEELRRAGQSVKKLEARLKVVADEELKLKARLAELQNAQEEAHQWRTKFEQTNGRLREKVRQFHALDKEYHAVLSSLSFRLGRVLTWLPRKVRGGVRCLREHGLKYTVDLLAKKIAKRMLPESFFKINRVFKETVMSGFGDYSTIIEKYGDDVTILGCALAGTGDYYICGLYLDAWLKKHNISNYVFLTLQGSQERVTSLFSVYKNHIFLVTPKITQNLRDFRGFVGRENQNFIYLDHQYPVITNSARNIKTYELMGYHGLNILDFYLCWEFKLAKTDCVSAPQLNDNREITYGLFTSNHLKCNKTVVLSPYSESNKGFLPPNNFWEHIVKIFTELGYTICTNCNGKEEPIKGTTPILLPYTESVPFLNLAGVFIGVRSGLCDVVATSICKKVVIHTYKARFWPDGNSIAYTGLCNMGLCDDAVEIEYREDCKDQILKSVVEAVLENKAKK